ncbi:alpha/beta-hydrolase [Sistotremastrum suecicum HHB10207 ss-3]|uniref:Carboxypeptidase n=1 Tax=Sistotremastrum suecicum HHB10207 ss-3 TaxID=1314776 RepID=A0A165XDS5_9AGAM|nr:alpha/beta-hydrolase [Sistotremastrum suecicum HHB10207 ss-3]
MLDIQSILLFLFLLLLPTLRANQIPSFDGIHGGVPSVASGVEGPRELFKEAFVNVTPTPGSLRYVQNTGVCETTPGVFSASGYADIAVNQSMWFWFFAARNNATSAPLTLWTNGGPGSSSMLGLFQEHGPCRISLDGSSLNYNPYSWNNISNMLYIDQPIGTGFSHGLMNVTGTKEAAEQVWQMLQIFFNDTIFSQYKSNDFALWTESYGGHYGPGFAAYFLDANEKIANGTLTGTPINLKTLGIGNGITDPLTQYAEYTTYAATNSYIQFASPSLISSVNASFYSSDGGCQQLIQACYSTSDNPASSAGEIQSVCAQAQGVCNVVILDGLIGPGNRDVYDVRQTNPDPYPPPLNNLLDNQTLIGLIGAESEWEETSNGVYTNFARTGDWMLNSAPDLARVINSGVRTLIYDGDADYILNYDGVEAMVQALLPSISISPSSFQFQNWTVSSHPAGLVRQSPSGNFTYVRVFGAGHEVPAYNYTNLQVGEAAFEFFNLTMGGRELVASPSPSPSSGGGKNSALRVGGRGWGSVVGLFAVVFLGVVSGGLIL